MGRNRPRAEAQATTRLFSPYRASARLHGSHRQRRPMYVDFASACRGARCDGITSSRPSPHQRAERDPGEETSLVQPRYSRIAVSRPGDRAAGSFHRPKDLHRTVAAATVVAKATCRKYGERVARQRSGNRLGDAFKRWQIFWRQVRGGRDPQTGARQ